MKKNIGGVELPIASSQADYIRQEVYDVLLLCWDKESEQRPPFGFVQKVMTDFFISYNVCVSIAHYCQILCT